MVPKKTVIINKNFNFDNFTDFISYSISDTNDNLASKDNCAEHTDIIISSDIKDMAANMSDI